MMRTMSTIQANKSQQGTALVVSLLILIAMTLIVLSGSRNTSMQLTMSSNLQSRVEALQMAQAGLDYAATLTADQTAGANTVCSTSPPSADDLPVASVTCDKSVDMPTGFGFDNAADGSSWLYLEADDAGLSGGCGRAMEISIETFECQFYKVYSIYDNTDAGQGRAVVGTGMMRVVPAGS
jgi:hypothetical protein